MHTEAPIKDQTPAVEALNQTAAQSIRNNIFCSMFESRMHLNGNRANEDDDDDRTNESETSLAQKWTENMRTDGPGTDDSTATAEDGNSVQSLTNVRIIGTELKFERSRATWWYLILHGAMTIFRGNSRGDKDLDSRYVPVDTVISLSNGHQFISFKPRWVRGQELPEDMRKYFWGKIGFRLWRHISSGDYISWDGRDNHYFNLSDGSSMHLCAKKEFKECSITAC